MYLSDITVTDFITHNMAAETNGHRYGAKLRHCHPMYTDIFHRTLDCWRHVTTYSSESSSYATDGRRRKRRRKVGVRELCAALIRRELNLI